MSPIVIKKTAGPEKPPSAAAQMGGNLRRERTQLRELPNLDCLLREARWAPGAFGDFGCLAHGAQVSNPAC